VNPRSLLRRSSAALLQSDPSGKDLEVTVPLSVLVAKVGASCIVQSHFCHCAAVKLFPLLMHGCFGSHCHDLRVVPHAEGNVNAAGNAYMFMNPPLLPACDEGRNPRKA
jgi:hypothetical protein